MASLSALYAGLMSGTSLDGVDGVLVDFAGQTPRVLAHHSAAFSPALREELLRLNTPGTNELHRAALAGNALVRVYASVVKQLLADSGKLAGEVRAVGAHGQTVRHRPHRYDGIGYTLQLNQPALLAELTGIDVVADFRSRDVAAGGQGAPLVPPFHRAIFGHLPGSSGILNIGGIANITLLDAAQPERVIGFDCGPGNALMDAWCQANTGAPFDAQGTWAAGGRVLDDLLQRLLDEPFFSQSPPKSTGRDLFNTVWLREKLTGMGGMQAQDVQTTLTELTARTSADMVLQHGKDCQQLVVCGGGALNTYLMSRLQALLPGCAVGVSDTYGLPALQVEATAFAWLARQCIEGKTASLKSVTGAKGARILGAIYPA